VKIVCVDAITLQDLDVALERGKENGGQYMRP